MSTSMVEYESFVDSLEKPFFEPIGRYVFRFGLERKVDEALCQLSGLEYFGPGQYIFNPIDFLARAHLLRVLARGSNFTTEVKQLTLDIEEQNTFRNDLVHGAWVAHFSNYDGKKDAWQKLGLSRRYNHKAFNVTCEDIVNNTKKVERLSSDAIRLSRLIYDARHPAVAEPTPSPDMPA